MKNGFVLVLFLVFTILIFANEITNKTLLKELKKRYPDGKYELEEIKISENKAIKGKFYRINSNSNQQLKYIYIGRVFTTRGGNNGGKQTEDAEYFDYFILYNALKTVQLVKIINFQATHGEGVTSVGWLKQFVGHSSKKQLTVGKNIDALSGATISVNNLTFDVQSKTHLLSASGL